MIKKKAKLIYKNNSFDIVEEGNFVICAISGKEIRSKPILTKNKLKNIIQIILSILGQI